MCRIVARRATSPPPPPFPLSLAQAYEELVAFHPDVDSYGLYYAQSLFKAGLYPEAERAAQHVDTADPTIAQRVAQLQVSTRRYLVTAAVCRE